MGASLPESLPGDYGKGPGKIPRRLVGVDQVLTFFLAKLQLVSLLFQGWKNCISKLPGLFYERGSCFSSQTGVC